MVKYITNVEFKDRYTWEIIPKGTELELTEERAEEIIKILLLNFYWKYWDT